MISRHKSIRVSPSCEFGYITLKTPDLPSDHWRSDTHLKPLNRRREHVSRGEKVEDDGLWCRRTRFFAKKVSHRVASGHGERRIGYNAAICDRRDKFSDEKFSRHFCELLGPNLCKDCCKHRMQSDALHEYHVSDKINNMSVDAFASFVQWNSNKDEDDYHSLHSEDLSDNESDIFINELADNEELTRTPSPPALNTKESPSIIPSTPTHDSGIGSSCSTRLSYIRSLVKTDSFPGPNTPSRQNTAFTRGATGRRDNWTPSSRESVDSTRLPSDWTLPSAKSNSTVARRFNVNNHLVTCHKKSLAALYSYGYPLKSKKDWIKIPVQPILMDLKLINFTSYDKAFCTLATGVGLGVVESLL